VQFTLHREALLHCATRGRRDAGLDGDDPSRVRCGSTWRPPAWDIPVYTDDMKVVKVRRVGNSNVVSIPREFEARGYAAGTSVLVEELDGGELRLIPTEQVRDRIRGIGKRVVDEHPEALQILAEHDPDDESAKR
jgi:antitoxin component of MazEF toxin-antitoxin module